MPDKFLAANIGYVPYQTKGFYAVCAKKREDYYWETFLFDTATGRLVGNALDPRQNSQSPKAAYFRQLLNIEDRLFLNVWNESHVENVNLGVLQEAQLVNVGENYKFAFMGEKFSPQLVESADFRDNFKKRWLVPSYYYSDSIVYTFDELQSRVWPYKLEVNEEESFQWERGRHIPYSLPGRVQTQELGFFQKTGEATKNDVEKWYYSFSRVVGAYPFGDGYLVSYINPNMVHPNYQRFPEQPSEGEENTNLPPYVMALQWMDSQFNNRGYPIKLPGRFCFGVISDIVFLFNPGTGTEGPALEIIPLSDFDAQALSDN